MLFIQSKEMNMFGLRQKMSLGFGGMLAILVIIGVQSVRHISSARRVLPKYNGRLNSMRSGHHE